MSRSQKTDVTNPSTRWFKWSGEKGQLKYWNGEEEVYVKNPFAFLVLDQLNTISGWDKDSGGSWANEVRNTLTEPLTVRCKGGIIAQGLYKDIKGKHPAIKYAKSLYIAFHDDNGELAIGNIKLSGAANSAFIEFSRFNDVEKGAVILRDATEEKNGATKYFAPKFEMKLDIKPEAEERALELDKQLQEYLTAYFAKNGQERASAATAGYNDDRYSDPNGDPPEYLSNEPPMPEFTASEPVEDLPF